LHLINRSLAARTLRRSSIRKAHMPLFPDDRPKPFGASAALLAAIAAIAATASAGGAQAAIDGPQLSRTSSERLSSPAIRSLASNTWLPLSTLGCTKLAGRENGRTVVLERRPLGLGARFGGGAVLLRERLVVDGATAREHVSLLAQAADGTVLELGRRSPVSAADGCLLPLVGTLAPQALKGVAMPSHPEPGQCFTGAVTPDGGRELARIRDVHARLSLPAGSFSRTLAVDVRLADGKGFEVRHFARGVGLVRVAGPAGVLTLCA
jgi:hypothetical protein